MKEVYPDIFSIVERGKFLGIQRPPENIFIIAGIDGLIYDAGYGDEKTVRYLVQEIRKIEKVYKEQGKEFNLSRILPSHPHGDHVSGLALIRELLNVRIILTRTTAEVIANKNTFANYYDSNYFEDHLYAPNRTNRFKHWFTRKITHYMYQKFFGIRMVANPDEIIEENTTISINGQEWEIFPSPGHCFGHISLYNNQDGILFSGDNVLRSITTWLGPPDSNIDDYIKSVKELQELPNLKLILPSHGSPVSNPKERIKEILDHRRARTEEILELVQHNSNHGIAPSEIIKNLYPEGSQRIKSMARGYVCLTLKQLEKEGLIKRIIGKKEIEFLPVPVD